MSITIEKFIRAMFNMYQVCSLIVLVAMCLGKSIDYAPAVQVAFPVDETAVAPFEPLTSESIFSGAPVEQLAQPSVVIKEPLPVEVAQPGLAIGEVPSEVGEVIDYPVPSVEYQAPVVYLPKDAQEVVDVPHANIELPGNSMVSKEVHLNLPAPIIEAPKPIIRNKDVLFRIPQPVIYIPKPIIQHKPMIYRMGHTMRILKPTIKAQPYLFKVPQAQITGKSAYTQPIPETYQGKSIL